MDNSYRMELVKTQDARNAIDALLAHKEVAVETHRRLWLLHQVEGEISGPGGGTREDQRATGQRGHDLQG